MTTFDAVILAGGRGERLGGVDKAALSIGRATLLNTVVAAAAKATQVICVGPERPTERPIMWTRERPPGGGPVAALAAGLELVEAPVVVLLAVDLPLVTPDVVVSLVERLWDATAVLAEDGDGIHQPLLAAYRTESLGARLRTLGDPAGASMTAVVKGLDVVSVPALAATQDVDTREDFDRLGIRLPPGTVR